MEQSVSVCMRYRINACACLSGTSCSPVHAASLHFLCANRDSERQTERVFLQGDRVLSEPGHVSEQGDWCGGGGVGFKNPPDFKKNH